MGPTLKKKIIIIIIIIILSKKVGVSAILKYKLGEDLSSSNQSISQ